VVIDQFLIDGLVNGAAALARGAGARTRALANGSLTSYAIWIGAGAAVLSFLWMWS